MFFISKNFAWYARDTSRPPQTVNFQYITTIISKHKISRPYHNNILSSGVFRRETASGFCPWGKVEGPRKRVAEGLCGWRHGNSFPMTQSTQSLRQMRSIPLCSKAVFYVFVFDSIHDSATLHNLCPNKYPLNRFLSNPPTSFLKCHRRGFNVCLQMGWNGAILGGILGGRRGVGESFAGFLAQGSILRVKGWTNEQFFARKVAF